MRTTAALVFFLAACGGAREGVPGDTPNARNAAMHAADAGSAEPQAGACTHDAPDGKALLPCREECDRGIASSCELLAARFERGEGIVRDLTRAAVLHERACELRDEIACVNAARMHAGGLGVPPSRPKQIELLDHACALGDASACTVAARAFERGSGVPRDERRATELRRKACAGGIEEACEMADDAGAR